MDMNAMLNAIASGPAPGGPAGVQQVAIPKITLPGIGQVPVPTIDGTPGGPPVPVVPGQPLPTGPGGNTYAPGGPGNPYNTSPEVAAKLGNLVPAAAGGAGNIIGQAGPASNPAGTMQIAGPRGDRTMVANIPTSQAAMLGRRVGGSPGLTALANAVVAGGGHLGTGMLGQAATQAAAPAAPRAATPLQQPIPQQNAQLMHIANQLAQPPASAPAAPARAPLTIAPIAQPFGQLVAPKPAPKPAAKPVAAKAAVGGAPRNR